MSKYICAPGGTHSFACSWVTCPSWCLVGPLALAAVCKAASLSFSLASTFPFRGAKVFMNALALDLVLLDADPLLLQSLSVSLLHKVEDLLLLQQLFKGILACRIPHEHDAVQLLIRNVWQCMPDQVESKPAKPFSAGINCQSFAICVSCISVALQNPCAALTFSMLSALPVVASLTLAPRCSTSVPALQQDL